MSIRVALRHSTAYHYDRLVHLSPQVIRLRPAPHCRTPILSYSLKIEPAGHFINWQQDPFGNFLARLVIPDKTRTFKVAVEVIAELVVINPFDFFLDENVEQFPFEYDVQLRKDLAPYLQITESGPQLGAWLKTIDRRPQKTIDVLVALNQQLAADIKYLIRMAPGVQTCEETLTSKSGSCRDSAWLMVQALRQLGLAARFVSGYLVQLAPDQKALDGPSGPAADFTDLHAWAEVYLPGAGWIGFDPTSGLLAGEGHIPLACTPDPVSAAAITGLSDPCEVEFVYENRVERIHEDARVTRPYSAQQWQAIDALGMRIDGELSTQDVRLTMGGEPTFVSIDDMQGAEWNTAALGQRKRELAGDLLLKLRDKFAPGGLLHFGQGKWYPGEPLPRWALSCFWRDDGEPLWRNDQRLARPELPGSRGRADAQRVMKAIAKLLGLPAKYIIPAYEDVAHYLLREGRLPINVDPADAKLDDPVERARLRRLFETGVGQQAGYVLPLKPKPRTAGETAWLSSLWPLRRERLYLLPGDSPLGLRLPIGSLPWEAERETEPARDPFAERGPLPRIVARRTRQPMLQSQQTGVIHTALCAEVRNGHLHIFLPPLTHIEDYLDLIAVIEATAEELDVPVVLEGYEPPRDPGLKVFAITPDPGVIEVNIHPARTWPELVGTTTLLYEEARQSRLGTEKFMIDGRHTGTGGGNHMTLGGATPADSPFLRRPGLLKSLVTYWQHHPALSYLFSGMFIGPTSQAPRVDEARDDNLYELEIALQQLPQDEIAAPWMVDRALRNFLVDLTGNTHRAEFCIDKLYAPGTTTGRRGLVELRAFEMPPHAQMTAVQMLLLRTLVANFWRAPLTRPLVRWGTELHDRFMLGHFVWEDLGLVIDDLRNAGYPLELDWFEPFRQFRFPHFGSIAVQGMQMDLNHALEPWHVLGEESGADGTARYVDSSVERMQVKISGLREDRYMLACNARRVPLRTTGTRGEYVAGVRYKAWSPPSALHPGIGVHAPLVFDIVDIATGRSIGGCTYHVAHPGGRNYDTFPVNANEAEARRIARFWSHGHSQGVIAVRAIDPHPDHPYTLDLRR